MMQVKLADSMKRLGTETAFEVLAKVVELRGQGKDIVSFCIGEPDFDTPKHIVDMAVKALHGGLTHYGPSAGLPEFRKACAESLFQTRGVPYSSDEIVAAPGAKPIIFFGLMALLNPGDEVIYPNPGFPIYESVINFLGAKAVPLPILESKGFSFDYAALEKLVTPKTRMVILNSPANPTGGVTPLGDLEKVAKLAIEKNLWVFSDEVYSRILYEGEFHSIVSLPGMRDRTILLEGHSKAYAMTGWRLGFGAMPVALARAVTQLMTNSVSCTASFTQMAGVEALRGPQEPTEAMVAEFRARRDLIVGLLNGIDGVSCLSPQGAFYVFPNVSKACKNLGFKDSLDVEDYLLFEAGVAVLARTRFGSKNKGEKDEYIRLSYATSQDNIRKGLARMKDALEDKARAQKFLKSRR